MARSRESKIELTAYDDLFQTDESREEAKLSKIRDIPIAEIDEFPDHPFKVLMDEDMEQLVDSIRRNGVMTPATVRLKEDGRYELISGHRRKKACELAGLDTLKCEVKELTLDEAIIVMVESNLQRSTILPSEKAFAYKMRLEAMNRQGQRTDLTSRPVGEKLFSVDKMSKDVSDSSRQIHRFIRLTELVPEILQMVDDRQIAFRPAVEISYLSEEQQYTLLEAMQYNDATPSLAQAIKMKKFMQDGKLTDEVIQSIMEEEKPNQKEKPAFRDERITKLIPKNTGTLNKKYRDKNPFENKLLTQNVRIGLDGKKHRRNLNILVCGGSGAGKTRFFCKPNAMQCNTSFVVLDPKGEIVRDIGGLLEKKGYEVRVLDLINMHRSHCYNPFVYLRNDNDVQRLVTNLFKATTPKGSQSQDPFWDTAASMLLLALVFYLKYEAPPEEQNFPMVMELLRAGEVREDDDSYISPLDELFDRLEMVNPEHIALKYYRDYHSGSAKTLKSIQITLAARLEKFNLESLAGLTATDELDLPSLGEKKVALYFHFH